MWYSTDNSIKSHVHIKINTKSHLIILLSTCKKQKSCFLIKFPVFFLSTPQENRRNYHRSSPYEMWPFRWHNVPSVWMIWMSVWFRHWVKSGILNVSDAPYAMINCPIGISRRMACCFVETIICSDSVTYANNVWLQSVGRRWLLANINSIPNVFAAFIVNSILAMVTPTLWSNGQSCFGKWWSQWKKKLDSNFCIFRFSGNCYRSKIDVSSVVSSLESPTSLSDILAPSTSSTHHQQQHTSQKPLPHSIRLVEIPWSKENKASLQFSIDGSQSGTMSPIAIKHNGVRISQ